MCEHYFGFRYGHLGVSFFYVLSGYVLAYIYDERINLRGFFQRRFARIYPAHFLIYLYSLPYFLRGAAFNHYGPGWIFVGALANLLLLHSWIPVEGIYFGFGAGSWSLSDEAFFYATFPLWRRRRLWPIALGLLGIILIALIVIRESHWLFYINPSFRLLEFLVGILCFRFKMKGGTRMELLAVGSMILAVMLAYHLPAKLTYSLVFLVPSALIVSSFAREEGVISRAISGDILVELGEASYALYLLHSITLTYIVHLIGQSLAVRIILAPIVILASVAMHRFYERPLRLRLIRT